MFLKGIERTGKTLICSWSRLNERTQEMNINLISSCHVETVVTLRGVKVDSHVSIDLGVGKLGL